MKYFKRIADDLLEEKLSYCGAIEIRGPKWCGKSTTAEQHAKSVIYMQDQETKAKNILLAKNAPSKFLEGETPRLIDEWQEVAFIWDQVRFEVDHRNNMGQFILTGSATPLNENAYSHSGIGRIIPMIMRPMSLYESQNSTGEVSLTNLFKQKKIELCTCDNSLEDYAYLTCRGGWPQVMSVEKKFALKIAYNFFDGLIKEDINKISKNKKNPEKIRKFLRAYARAESTETSLETLTQDIKILDELEIDKRTTSNYIEALKKLYVIEELPAWSPNLRSKTTIRTSNTRHFVDPSIACASLRIGPNDLMSDMKTFGLLFESLCVRDLRVYADKLDGEIYHYKDNTGLEADAIIHLRSGNWAAVEIKLRNEDAIEEGAKNLISLSNKIDKEKMKPPSFLMVLTATEVAYQRDDGVFVVPIGCLAP